MITNLTDTIFKTEVLDRKDTLCLIDFWATWCEPCKMMLPILQKISDKYQGRLFIGKYDVEGNSGKIANDYGVVSLPTLLLIKNGKVLFSNSGLMSQSLVEARIEEYI